MAAFPQPTRARSGVHFTVFLLLAAVATGCGSRQPSGRASTMPNPEGCFVQVWDHPGFTGASEFLNGPRRYDQLKDLPGGSSWKRRVRSIRLGPSAEAVAWSSERFAGRNVRLTTKEQGGGFDTLPERVESLEIQCTRPVSRFADNSTIRGWRSQ
jgi:hypothetical protein